METKALKIISVCEQLKKKLVHSPFKFKNKLLGFQKRSEVHIGSRLNAFGSLPGPFLHKIKM